MNYFLVRRVALDVAYVLKARAMHKARAPHKPPAFNPWPLVGLCFLLYVLAVPLIMKVVK